MTIEFDSIEDLKRHLNIIPDGIIIRLEMTESTGGKEDENEKAQRPDDGR